MSSFSGSSKSLGSRTPNNNKNNVVDFLPGAASLCEMLDHSILIILRDGRHLLGILRSYDQFNNIVLEHTKERFVCGNLYSDQDLGLYAIRGDCMVLMAEIDEDSTKSEKLKEVTMDELLDAREKEGIDGHEDWDFEAHLKGIF